MPKILVDKNPFIIEFCRGKSVLDVGCVNHTVEETFKPKWQHAQLRSVAREIVGIDYEKTAIESLKERGFNVLFADAQDFDIRDKYPNGFEVIIASEILEHLVNPGLFFGCLRKHLAKDGMLLVTTPHAYGLFFFLQVLAFGNERFNDDHTFTFSRKNLEHLLNRCGLRVDSFHWLIQDTSRGVPFGLRWLVKKILFLKQMAVATVRPGFAKEMIVIARAQ